MEKNCIDCNNIIITNSLFAKRCKSCKNKKASLYIKTKKLKDKGMSDDQIKEVLNKRAEKQAQTKLQTDNKKYKSAWLSLKEKPKPIIISPERIAITNKLLDLIEDTCDVKW